MGLYLEESLLMRDCLSVEPDSLALHHDMPIVEAALRPDNHGICADLSAGSLKLRDGIAHRWISPTGLVALGGNDADGRIRALGRGVENLDLAGVRGRVWLRHVAMRLVGATPSQRADNRTRERDIRKSLHIVPLAMFPWLTPSAFSDHK